MNRRWTCLLLSALAGCAQLSTVERGPQSWLDVNLAGSRGPSPRTLDALHEVDLESTYSEDPARTRIALAEQFSKTPRREWAFALSEMALLEGRRAQCKKSVACTEHYYRSLQYAYAYLFDPRIAEPINPLDPRTRLACDLYNAALSRLIQIARDRGDFNPQGKFVVQTSSGLVALPVRQRGFPWRPDEIDSLVPAERAQAKEVGRDVRTYGVGVPMLGLRKKPEACEKRDEFLVGCHPFAVTVLLHPETNSLFQANAEASADLAQAANLLRRNYEETPSFKERRTRVRERDPWTCDPSSAPALELVDPLNVAELQVGNRRASLEAELSSPIVYSLRTTPRTKIELTGFLHPERAEKEMGLVMLQPYQKGKIPVVFVHGLLSDPLTWTEMFNELGADPEIRKKYQFWAFFYPTGLPFIKSAAKLRADLERVRMNCDPEGDDPALDRMVLVGHSMGGLISRLQTTKSGDDYWNLVSTKPFKEVKANDESRDLLRQVFFFEPSRTVSRVVYIGVPHRGSAYSKSYIGRFGSWLVRLPRMVLAAQQQLLKDNPEAFKDVFKGAIPTSVDLLSEDSKLLKVMYDAETAPGVKAHTIVGEGIKMASGETGDGIVPASSATLPNVASELRIRAIHEHVHRHPRATLEVKRILHEHWKECLSDGSLRKVTPAAGVTPMVIDAPAVRAN
jgi:pimeloyl-ACP methyl ester carboxylesterase